jgi:integrase/recombinase XerC/integrase/recombinase XerD
MVSDFPNSDEDETSPQLWVRPEQYKKLIRVAHNPTEQMKPGNDEPVTGWTHLNLRDELLVQVMYDTGLREGEVVLLDEADLRLQHEKPHIFVPPEKQKRQPRGRPRKAARMTFDFETTAQKLRIWKDTRWKDTPALFPSQMSSRLTANRVWQIVTELAIEAGIEPYAEDGTRADPSAMHPHAFRHSIAYRYLVVEDKSIEDVKQRLRHRHLETTERFYEHFLMR